MDDYRESVPDPEDWVPPDGQESSNQPPPTGHAANDETGQSCTNDAAPGERSVSDGDTAGSIEPDATEFVEEHDELVEEHDELADPDADGSAEPDAADADADADVEGLRARLDGVVGDSRLMAAADASRLRGIYAMLQDALEHPGVFIPNSGRLSRADLTGESEGWVRSALAQEIGAALGVTKGQAAGLVDDAETLCQSLPATLNALEAGQITRQHTAAMIRQSIGLSAEATSAFERDALPKAIAQSPTQFCRAAVTIRESLFPETITQRRTEAVKDRRVDCYGTQDGMGVLSLYAPIEVVQCLTAAARSTGRALKAAGDQRTLAQIETDTIIDAIMIGFTTDTGQPHGTDHKPGTAATGVGADRLGGIRPTVYVTVPVMTLLGHTQQPAHLDGYGPIDPNTARNLAAQAPSFIRLLTHPETGAVLSVGRDRYTVPADLKRAVHLRDETCIGIGCDRPATTCDLDHRQQWQHGGETSLSNLHAACEQHHMIRHHTTWNITITDDNSITWTSPLGKTYKVPHTSNIQFTATDTADENEQPTETDGTDTTAGAERQSPADSPPF